MKKPTFDTSAIKAQVEENPLLALGVAGAASSGILSGLAKLLNAKTAAKNSKTYRREVKRREKLVK